MEDTKIENQLVTSIYTTTVPVIVLNSTEFVYQIYPSPTGEDDFVLTEFNYMTHDFTLNVKNKHEINDIFPTDECKDILDKLHQLVIKINKHNKSLGKQLAHQIKNILN